MDSIDSDDNNELMEASTDISDAEAETKMAPSNLKRRHKFEVQWDEKLKELREYKRLHGDCSVPVKSKIYGKLGKWCENQRYSFTKGKLAQDRIDRLRGAGFVFEGKVPRTPEKRFPTYTKLRIDRIDELKEFIKKFGNANVPAAYSINPQLGKWVENTRGKYKKNELSEEEIEELTDAGFSFETPQIDKYHSYAYDHRWNEKFTELMNYKNEHGDFNVPISYNKALSEWVENQKYIYRKGRLSQERIDRLEDVGFSFARKSRKNETQTDEA